MGRQLRCQVVGHAAAVRGQHPYARRLLHLRRAARQNDAPIGLATGFGLVDAQYLCFPETGVTQRPPPDGRASQGVMGTVVVGEPPPAVQLAEREVKPALTAQVFERHQLAERRQERPAVGQRFAQVACGVQHVGGNQQVIPVGGESLF